MGPNQGRISTQTCESIRQTAKNRIDSHSRSWCIDYSTSRTDSDVGDIPHNWQVTAL